LGSLNLLAQRGSMCNEKIKVLIQLAVLFLGLHSSPEASYFVVFPDFHHIR